MFCVVDFKFVNDWIVKMLEGYLVIKWSLFIESFGLMFIIDISVFCWWIVLVVILRVIVFGFCVWWLFVIMIIVLGILDLEKKYLILVLIFWCYRFVICI